jgi:hypothetical protein
MEVRFPLPRRQLSATAKELASRQRQDEALRAFFRAKKAHSTGKLILSPSAAKTTILWMVVQNAGCAAGRKEGWRALA